MMDWWDRVRAYVQAVVGFDIITESTASGEDFVESDPVVPPAKKGKRHARRMWPFGIRSVIPKGVGSVTVCPRASNQKVIVGAESRDYGPSDLEEGETAIYCKTSGAVIKLDKDGKITIDTPSPQDVVVNGGVGKVAIEGDLVNKYATFATWMGNVEAALAGLGAPVAPLVGNTIGTIVINTTRRFKA